MFDDVILKRTDWTAYYKKKKSWFSTHTQKYTLDVILKAIERNVDKKKDISILELGGGNSCFAEEVCNLCNVDDYDIVDTNELAVKLFNEQKIGAARHKGIIRDLTVESMHETGKKYDFVYSVGLIEHFRGKDIEEIIKRHFEFCCDGGVVLITFPTPTKKYFFIRKCMELIGAWQFYDERPLRYEEVKGYFKQQGNIKQYFINKKLPLTQMVVIARKE